MGRNKERIRGRKEACAYIRGVVDSKIRRTKSVTDLADALGGTFGLKDDLKSLCEGRSDPSPRLIEAFKNLFGSTIPDREVRVNLIEPFLTKP